MLLGARGSRARRVLRCLNGRIGESIEILAEVCALSWRSIPRLCSNEIFESMNPRILNFSQRVNAYGLHSSAHPILNVTSTLLLGKYQIIHQNGPWNPLSLSTKSSLCQTKDQKSNGLASPSQRTSVTLSSHTFSHSLDSVLEKQASKLELPSALATIATPMPVFMTAIQIQRTHHFDSGDDDAFHPT